MHSVHKIVFDFILAYAHFTVLVSLCALLQVLFVLLLYALL